MSNIKENWTEMVIVHLLEFRRWTSPITDVVWSIEMPSFDYLKDVYVIFIQQICNKIKTRINKGYTSRKTH